MNVTCATLVSTLKGLAVAASINVTGPCPSFVQILSAPAGTSLDFAAAPVSRLELRNVSGITLEGVISKNAPQSAINVVNSSQILISHPHIIHPGAAGIAVQGSDTVELDGPWVSQSLGDGIDISGSRNVNVHDGGCENNIFTSTPADCVQMGSVANQPLQHVIVQNMIAAGKTKGFDAFDPQNLGANDIQFLNNHAAISVATCVGAAYVRQLVVTGNDCHTMPGATAPAGFDVTNSPGAIMSGNSPGAAP